MHSENQDKPPRPGKGSQWLLAFIGVVLFSITVAPDYPVLHVTLGAFIVVGIHLLTAFFRRSPTPSVAPVVNQSSEPLVLSNTATLIVLLPLALAGVIGILVGGTSAWHAYFCALAIGAFTAMCWLFPSRPNKRNPSPAQ